MFSQTILCLSLKFSHRICVPELPITVLRWSIVPCPLQWVLFLRPWQLCLSWIADLSWTPPNPFSRYLFRCDQSRIRYPWNATVELESPLSLSWKSCYCKCYSAYRTHERWLQSYVWLWDSSFCRLFIKHWRTRLRILLRSSEEHESWSRIWKFITNLDMPGHICLHSWHPDRGVGGNLSSKYKVGWFYPPVLINAICIWQTADIPTRNTRPTKSPSFIKAMQFALSEYICVSSDDEQDGCPPFYDDIHASAFGVFHSHVISS